MKRLLEVDTGQFPSLYIPPEHKSRKAPGATYESLCGIRIEPVKPTWRDLWRILRGRYEPKLSVTLVGTVEAMEFALHETWTTEKLEEQLYTSSPLLDFLE